MSAGIAVRDALAARLRAELGPEPNGVAVFAGEPAAGVFPHVEVAEAQGSDWSAVGFRGRELRTAVTVRVAAGQRGRMAALVAGAEAAGEGLDGEFDGWLVVGAVFLRSRVVKEKGGGVTMVVEHRVRVVAV